MAHGEASGRIRVGIGGWNFAPWRGGFYPEGLPQRAELNYASRQVTAIEINATFYGSQKRESFARWREEAPDGFVFSLKGPRFATNRRVLAEAGESITRFLGTGIAALGEKLGPINWQLAATKRFDPDDFARFLDLLPGGVEDVPLRHAVEMRHESFLDAKAVELLRERNVAWVIADSDAYAQMSEVTASFVYARLQNASESEVRGYSDRAIAGIASQARGWLRESGGDVFIYFINGFKPRAPHAAMALLEAVDGTAR
jgi:uncharacterized protein YecE (DUF72 family)